MAQPTFEEVMDWLAQNEGSRVYTEVGIKDPSIKRALDPDWILNPGAVLPAG